MTPPEPIPTDGPERADTSVQCQNLRGEWVPAIPLPFYGSSRLGRKAFECDARCGRKFGTEEGYRGHYALVHILGLS